MSTQCHESAYTQNLGDMKALSDGNKKVAHIHTLAVDQTMP